MMMGEGAGGFWKEEMELAREGAVSQQVLMREEDTGFWKQC